MNNFQLETVAVIGVAFLLGGLVKGVIGIGLPLVVVPALATYSNPLTAVSLMVVPAITSNIMQAYQANLQRETVVRFWPAMIAMVIGAFVGSRFLTGASDANATVVLGAVVVLFCLTQLLSGLPPIPKHLERPFTVVAGALSGAAGGLSGFFGLALVPYLFALRLDKETFVAAIAVLYLSGVLSLYSTLALTGELTRTGIILSIGATLPTLLGVWLGSLVRQRVSEVQFRRALVIALLIIAANLLRKALW
ncbi:MAG: sulfite exporter TauE/SafE family protein [Pseudomonadota bacterium]